MKQNKFFIFGALGILVVVILLVGSWVWMSDQVTITTDKTEYEQGETVKITVGNSTDEEKEICSPFYTVENFDGEKWIEIKKVLCPCEVVCKLANYIVLQPNKSMEYEWNQKEEWCSDPTRISMTVSNQVPAGRYRLKSYIGSMEAECEEIYSNEFRIKGKEVVLDEKYCETSDDCVPVRCSCHCSGCGGFSYDDIVNKKYVNIWYQKQNCEPPEICPMVCCPLRTVACENNRCVVKEGVGR